MRRIDKLQEEQLKMNKGGAHWKIAKMKESSPKCTIRYSKLWITTPVTPQTKRANLAVARRTKLPHQLSMSFVPKHIHSKSHSLPDSTARYRRDPLPWYALSTFIVSSFSSLLCVLLVVLPPCNSETCTREPKTYNGTCTPMVVTEEEISGAH